jgi:hypothetical protein
MALVYLFLHKNNNMQIEEQESQEPIANRPDDSQNYSGIEGYAKNEDPIPIPSPPGLDYNVIGPRITALEIAIKIHEKYFSPTSIAVVLMDADHICKYLTTGEYVAPVPVESKPRGRRPGGIKKAAPVKKAAGKSKPGRKPGVKKGARR